MDNLKTLMDKKQYHLVVKLTEKSSSPTDLFYRISALLALGCGQEALSCLKEHRKVLETNLAVLMKIHIELLCILGLFDEALEEMNYYESLPYQSQEVEELLHKLPKYIRDEEKKTYASKHFDNEQVLKLLKSDDINEVVPALDIVRDREIKDFLPVIKDLMVNSSFQTVRSFALLMLVQKQIDETIDFLSKDRIIQVNPKNLVPPFVGKDFNFFVKKLEITLRNSSLLETALSLHASYSIYNYPNMEDLYSEKMLVAIYYIAHKYMKANPEKTLAEMCFDKELDEHEVEDFIKNIEQDLENF